MTYKGYADKDNRKQYLKEYMRDYRRQQKIIHEQLKAEVKDTLKVYMDFPTQAKTMTNIILSSENPLNTVKAKLEEQQNRLLVLDEEQKKLNKSYEDAEKTGDPHSIKLLVDLHNIQRRFAQTLDILHWLDCIVELSEKQIIKEEAQELKTNVNRTK